ncbi:helix-turn-helix domain-containing protein (plasmid) [Rhizobium sp. CB3171]|uniref:helix-turn-helix domain-containing protein n=1 Tax=Rhizobium sp. CB3171 TaxID=3039157 RepID=UPI0024B1887A|nr:helix-turn-helix domain-containing protein [Rhizobium sp. CB3171]WFU06695.1 helix-turn-helix domain-containing protein [Rhizobium sp. CB3171]
MASSKRARSIPPREGARSKVSGSEFFDPHDAVQVKYEMLRRVSIDKVSVTEASDEYGVSRPTYYQAKVNFDMAGIAGLVPTKPGPRGPHKIDDKVLAFLQAQLAQENPFAPGNWPSCSARNSISSFIPDRSSGF